MGIDSKELRSMVRDVLREAMAARNNVVVGPVPVRIATDADLQAFVARISVPGVMEAMLSGTMKFTLANSNTSHATQVATHYARPLAGIALDGVVSERKLAGIPKGSSVKLTATAVVTPMAKDIARRLGLTFERIEP